MPLLLMRWGMVVVGRGEFGGMWQLGGVAVWWLGGGFCGFRPTLLACQAQGSVSMELERRIGCTLIVAEFMNSPLWYLPGLIFCCLGRQLMTTNSDWIFCEPNSVCAGWFGLTSDCTNTFSSRAVGSFKHQFLAHIVAVKNRDAKRLWREMLQGES